MRNHSISSSIFHKNHGNGCPTRASNHDVIWYPFVFCLTRCLSRRQIHTRGGEGREEDAASRCGTSAREIERERPRDDGNRPRIRLSSHHTLAPYPHWSKANLAGHTHLLVEAKDHLLMWVTWCFYSNSTWNSLLIVHGTLYLTFLPLLTVEGRSWPG